MRLSLFESINHRQQYDDSQEGGQNRGAVGVEVTIFFVVFDGFCANVVPGDTSESRLLLLVKFHESDESI